MQQAAPLKQQKQKLPEAQKKKGKPSHILKFCKFHKFSELLKGLAKA
jgi:hypothetical protein